MVRRGWSWISQMKSPVRVRGPDLHAPLCLPDSLWSTWEFQSVNHPNLRQMSRVGKVNGMGCLSLLTEQRGSLDDNLKLYV